MTRKRPPKKTDTLEVRMPHETKRAFLETCRAEGRTASEVVRGYVESHLRRARPRPRDRHHPERSLVMIMNTPAARRGAFGGGALAACLGAIAIFTLGATPSAAQYDYRASFASLDANGDGVITPEEYEGAGSQSTVGLDLQNPGGAAPSSRTDGRDDGVVEFSLLGEPLPMPPMIRLEFMLNIGFEESDRNADGSIDFDEFVARHEQMLADEFARHDVDRNGRLSSEELYHNPDSPGSPPSGLPTILFDALDHDGDGAVNLAEFQAGPG